MKRLAFCILLLGLTGCNDFMSPDKMAESVEAQERCNDWQEETRRETMRFGMVSLLVSSCQSLHLS